MAEIKPLAAGSFGAVDWLITSRWGGVSTGNYSHSNFSFQVSDETSLVRKNREILQMQIGKPLIYPVACHGNSFAEVDRYSSENIEQVDALLSYDQKIALAVLSADCATILIHAEDISAICAIHAGYRGVRDKILPNVLTHLIDNGATKIQAVIGPTICADCYPVEASRYQDVKSAVDSAAVLNKHGKYAIDIQRGLVSQFSDFGVIPQLVEMCTFENPDTFSYRRGTQTGRMASAIWFN